ncbi:MAG TPA: SRPBCC family protein [Mycobacteriales bacterium]|jgi:carbon monoxide dehydrogenase subunit G|nr:SRPBCC family protein [Mycobacteriales bacterium]
MRIETDFRVNAPADTVWAYLLDVEGIVTCVPGAEILTKVSDDEYQGRVKLKVGPLGLNLLGAAVIESRDAEARVLTLSGKGNDQQGKGVATVSVVARVEDAGEGTSRVAIEQDLRVTGRIAQFGRGVMRDVSQRLSQEFARSLEAKMAADAAAAASPGAAVGEARRAAPPQATAVGGFGLALWAMSRAVGRFLRRVTGRPAPAE